MGLAGGLWTPLGGAAQIAEAPRDTVTLADDPSDVVRTAMAAQARFERRRIRYLPMSHGAPGGGRCDEHVGRFCEWYMEGEWYPVPEDPEIVRMRTELLARLDELQDMAPESGWILGQRVWYRAEAGDWPAAVSTARACGGSERWWCAALEGFALHGAGRYTEADAAFGSALAEMDEERRQRWTVPRWPVDGDVRAALDEVREDPVALQARLERLWILADPLYLAPGNDRRTAHFARWTVSVIRERARNPFHIPWGDDLTQLTVRHGWAMGWDRSLSRVITSPDDVISHNHPEGRDFMPRGEALTEPGNAGAEALRADRHSPRSLYAPDYAPVFLPMDGQLAVFPRVDEVVMVASQHLPDDTTFHADHDHPLPWMEPGAQADLADRIGLYAVDVEAAAAVPPDVLGTERRGRAEGSLALRVPPGTYVVSSESWSPSARRAGRLRRGLKVGVAVEDVAAVSDLVLLTPGVHPESLGEAVDHLLPRLTLGESERFAVAWEVAGLGFRPETLDFQISVERRGRNVFRRVGEFLRLADRPRPLGISWQEPAADAPGPSFHAIDLDLPQLDPGRYEIRLILRTADRSPVERTLEFQVVDDAPR
jgi:hypothetical protein